MKHLIIILAFAVSLFILTQAVSVHAQSGTDQPFVEQPASPQGMGQQSRPQGGPGSFMPLFFLIVIYLVIRRMYKNMQGGDDSPFGSDRDFDDYPGNRRAEDDPEHMKDAYDNARRMWDTFNARPDAQKPDGPKPGQDIPAGEPRPAPQADAEQKKPAQVIDISEAASGSHVSACDDAGQSDDEFLMGARLVFERMVEAMDGLDPDQASQFAGQGVVNEIKMRKNEGHPPAHSEVVRVDAKVMSRSVENGVVTTVVYYDGVKQVSGLGPIQMRQLWTFTKDDNDPAAMWMLQSIEPVEA